MEGNLKPKMMVVLLAAYWATAAPGQAVECVADEQCHGGVGYYCDPFSRCRQCLSCEELKRKPSPTRKDCITSVTDCGGCLEGLMEDVQGLRCVGSTPPLYAWVLIALGGLLLFGAAAAIVVYVLRNTHTFRVFTSARTSVQPGCNGSASAPELPPPYEDNKQYSRVRPESPHAPPPPPPPPHFIDEEAAYPFIKYPSPLAPACESAGNQEASVYNNPSYVRGPHLPNNYHAGAREPEHDYLVDDSTAESAWRPGDAANNNTAGESTDSGSVASTSGAGAGAGAGAGEEAGAASLSAQVADARSTTLVRPACQDAATPNKVPRLRQDTNNNRDRDRDDESMPRPSPAGERGPTFSIHVNVQQINDVKL